MKPVSLAVREDAKVPFDRWLATELARILERPVPRGLARKAILAGEVAVGGRIERNPGRTLRRGPSVFVRRLDWLPDSGGSASLHVLYEDDAVIAVDKPAGLPTHETKDPGRPSLTRLVERHVGHRVFVHHRLDAGTSGVVLFAKGAGANASLARSFADREVHKTYVALVRRPEIDWPAEMTIDTPIRVGANGSVQTDPQGSAATTRVRVLGQRADTVLIQVMPVSGRKHQIRVHLASIGAPVVGDARYGGRPSPTGRLMLHAERIELDHPITGEPLVVGSSRPREFQGGGIGKGPARGPEASLSGLRFPRATDPRATPSDPHSGPFVDSRRVMAVRKARARRMPGRGAGRGSLR